jgi:hypothetical protein
MPRKPGRPKTSLDVTRTCPYCGAEFVLPEWNSRKFCSAEHARLDRIGKPRPQKQPIEKICANPECPLPGGKFRTYPSHHYVKTCSRECSNAWRRRQAQQRVREMSQGECMWFAGLFDGEGSIIRARNRTAGHFRIQVYNCVRPLLERIVEYTGVGYIRERSVTNPRHSPSWVWDVGAAEALEILRQVRPWLIVKAERADAVLSGKTFPRQARWDLIYGPEP